MPDLDSPADCYLCGRRLTVTTGELWDGRPQCRDLTACDRRHERQQRQARKATR